MVSVDVSVGNLSNKIYKQCIAAAGALLIMLQTGIMSGWTSPNIARLTADNATIPLTLTEASWVASCLNLGRFASAVIVPIFIELIGSKTTVLVSFIPVSISWLLMIFVNSPAWLYIARFFGGISFGMAYGCFSLFLGEVSMPAYRGTFITIAMCGAPLGTVFATIGETYLPMMTSSAIYLVQCLAGIILFLWLPDSAHHLVKMKQIDKARESICWYRGNNELDKELNQITSFVETYANETLSEKMSQLKSAPIRKALLLAVVLFIFPQMCGLFNIMFYMEIILQNGKSFLINPQEFVIYANTVAVFSTFIAIKLIDYSGRRLLLFSSSVIVAIAMTSLGTHFYLLDLGYDSSALQWLPIASILLFMIGFTIGFMIVPATVFSEIFPAGIKSTASSISTFTSALFGFVSAKSYQPMVDSFGEAYVFWIHAVFAILAVPVTMFMLPETKGKNFQEIQDLFHKKKTIYVTKKNKP
ncbi:facilitated trehalose transporter Tret1-like [Phymastichus coffea]|uniref:facilitated trehalose transporter Tret1-like n=1 Tax=Phymastichus coffea TaxID=108790 RepID=UPI00273CA4D7|nr:facilitated trehalose transporter Tret1-like [Phymastichus coffea]